MASELLRAAMLTAFQRPGEECDIAKMHLHRFRHTFATWAIVVPEGRPWWAGV